MKLVSLAVPNSATTAAVAISGTSAQSALLTGSDVVVMPTVDCYVVRGRDPTATVPGASAGSMPILANLHWRLTGIQPDEKLAFITSGGTGTAYVTDNA